jgi:hypothetical protein
MKNLSKGLIVAVLHILIVFSLGGKLLYDRAHRPRIWVKTGSVDPDLPIRGRYFTLSLEIHSPDLAAMRQSGKEMNYTWQPVTIAVENGQLVAHPTDTSTDTSNDMNFIAGNQQPRPSGTDLYLLSSGVVFFIPEHAETPRLGSGDELWAEVTIPRKGPPRPIQLAIKHGTEWRPLTYR